MSKAVARVATWLRSRSSADGGFTLVEIVISVSLLGLITGAATTSMITATNGARITSQRAHESTDAQLISAFLVRDAQAAGGSNPATGTIDSSLGVALAPAFDACTPTNTRVRFSWIDRAASTAHANTAAYALDTASHQLVRRSCRDGLSSGDMVLGTRVANFAAVCNPNVCPGLPNLVTVTVTELADPSYSQFTYDLVAQLRPEAQAAPSIFNSTPVPLLALGGGSCPSSHAFIDLHGSPTLQVQLGGVIVNSYVSGCAAVNVGGAGTYSAGSTSVLAPNTCTVSGCTTYTQPIADPLAGLPPLGGTCGGGGNPPLIGGVYQPGVYNNAVTISPSTTANFADGNYKFCNGLDVKGTVVAPHVLFYFAGGSLTVNSNGTITIGSQVTAPYSLVSIWQPHNDDLRINGGAGLDSYKGIIYAPLSVVYITGGTNLQIGSVIAYAIDLGGNGYAAFGPGVTIVTPLLPPAFVGVFYSVTMAAAGGPPTPTPPPLLPRYRNWQASGLPGGFTINAASGVLSGTTNLAASYPNVVISVTDYVPIIPVTTTRTYTLNVGSGSLAIVSTSPLAQATASTNYSMTFQASGGNLGLTGAYQWTNSTPLPAGLSWTGNGVISGSPTTTTTFTIDVKDDSNTVVSKFFTLTVNPVPAVTTGTALLSTVTATFSKSQTFSGGTGPFSWGILAGDSLPAGLSPINSSTGVISGTPTTAATTSFTVVLTDANGAQAPRLFTMTVYAKPVITTASLPAWDAGTPYPNPTQMTISGGSPPLTWSATGMPTGLTLSSSGAVLGTPTTAGTYSSIVATATDQSGVSATANFSVVIAAALAISTPASLPNGELPLAYGPITATSAGGTGAKTWTATNMPPGVVISSAGVISGTPTTVGDYTPTITVQDAIGVFVSRTLPKVTVFPALSATFSNTFPGWDAGAVNPNYAPPTAPIVSGGSGAYTWSVAGLPAGLALNASTGAVTGTPSTAGSYNPITWTVSDSLGASISRTYGPVTVYNALTITGNNTFPNWDQGFAYPAQTLTGGGGSPGAKVWSATGLPTGMSINSVTGAVSGTPGATGLFKATFTYADPTVGASISVQRTFTISTPPTITTPAGSLPTWTVGKAYPTTTFALSGGATPVTWSIAPVAVGGPSFAAATGLTFNASTGQISGTPTGAISNVSYTVTATDAVGMSDSKVYSLTLNPAISVTGLVATASYGSAYTATLTSTGGTGAITWTAPTGLPTGLTWNPGTRQITGTPTVTGSFTVTVTATDASPVLAQGSQTVTMVIRPAPASVSMNNVALGGHAAGVPEKGDQLIVTFTEAIKPSTLCSTWPTTTGAAQTANVLVTFVNGTNDQITVGADGGCTPTFGSIDLGGINYVTANVVFGGNGGASTYALSADGKTLTITLGKASSSGPLNTVANVNPLATYTPAAAISNVSSPAALIEGTAKYGATTAPLNKPFF